MSDMAMSCIVQHDHFIVPPWAGATILCFGAVSACDLVCVADLQQIGIRENHGRVMSQTCVQRRSRSVHIYFDLQRRSSVRTVLIVLMDLSRRTVLRDCEREPRKIIEMRLNVATLNGKTIHHWHTW